jgi:ribosome-binding factor A
MPLTHRVERIAAQIREELSQMIATEVRDPGVGLVTVTRVKVTADLSLARVYWTVLGETKEKRETAKALNRTVPYLRHLLSQRLTLRRAPEIKFQYDESTDNQLTKQTSQTARHCAGSKRDCIRFTNKSRFIHLPVFANQNDGVIHET